MSEDPIVKLLIVFLTTPSSNFYLSKLIGGSTSPVLEPLSAGNIDLGSQTIAGIDMSIALNNVVVSGLSSIQVAKTNGQPDITVNGDTVSFVAEHPNTEAPPAGVPSILTLKGAFAASAAGTAINGSFEVEVKSLTIDGTFTATSPDGSPANVVITFQSLTLNTAATTSNMSIKLNIDSTFTPFINSLMNTPGILGQIMDGVKSELSSPTVMSGLSKAATDGARSALANSPIG